MVEYKSLSSLAWQKYNTFPELRNGNDIASLANRFSIDRYRIHGIFALESLVLFASAMGAEMHSINSLIVRIAVNRVWH